MLSQAAVFVALLAGASVVPAFPLVAERAGCSNYVIISTRGTGEPQGPSVGFVGMIRTTLGKVAGGVEHDTVYPADASQISTVGTTDILNQIDSQRASCPDTKFALLGYSQGAAATVNALQRLDPASGAGAAVKAVVLIGDPMHLPGKKSNVDQSGGSATDGAFGIEAYLPGAGIPAVWDNSGKVMDICYVGDGVCSGAAITFQHLLYGSTPSVQTLGSNFLVKQLQ